VKWKKVVLMALALLMLVCMASCSAGNKLIGKWQDDYELVEFKKDGSFSASYYWLGGSYTIDGDALILSAALTGKKSFTYAVEGDTLYLYGASGSVQFEFTRVGK